jgi:hypothetical protein
VDVERSPEPVMHMKFSDMASGRKLKGQNSISDEHVAITHRQYSTYTKSILEHQINTIFEAEIAKLEASNIPKIHKIHNISKFRFTECIRFNIVHTIAPNVIYHTKLTLINTHNTIQKLHHIINNSGKTYAENTGRNIVNTNAVLCFIKR